MKIFKSTGLQYGRLNFVFLLDNDIIQNKTYIRIVPDDLIKVKESKFYKVINSYKSVSELADFIKKKIVKKYFFLLKNKYFKK